MNEQKKVSMDSLKDELLRVLNETTGRNFRVLPAQGCTKLLKTFTLDEIRYALEAMMRTPWHQRMVKELSSDYLLRPTVIDKFCQVAVADKYMSNKLSDEEIVEL